jgi:hypothetical protein
VIVQQVNIHTDLAVPGLVTPIAFAFAIGSIHRRSPSQNVTVFTDSVLQTAVAGVSGRTDSIIVD